MAYDPVNRDLILFDPAPIPAVGPAGAAVTWAWDGGSWRQLNPAANPGSRGGYLMATDPDRNQVLLFGGVVGPNQTRSDTWAWDGHNWQKLDVPDAGYGSPSGLVFEPISRRMMLFGPEQNHLQFLERTGWTSVSYSNKALPYGGTLVTDEQTGHVLLFGGAEPKADGALVSTIYKWDGSDWVEVPSSDSPIERRAAQGTSDPVNGGIFMFGGEGRDQYLNGYALNDTWNWGSGLWTLRSPLTAVAKVRAIFLLALISQPPAGEVFQLRLTKPDGTVVTADLCDYRNTAPCNGETGYEWSFLPMDDGGTASYIAFHGQGTPTYAFTAGTVNLVRGNTYYIEYVVHP
jgi:hypothetical protein